MEHKHNWIVENTFINITVYSKKPYIRLSNIHCSVDTCVTGDTNYIQKTIKWWTTHGLTITTVAVSFSYNISNTMLRGHPHIRGTCSLRNIVYMVVIRGGAKILVRGVKINFFFLLCSDNFFTIHLRCFQQNRKKKKKKANYLCFCN